MTAPTGAALGFRALPVGNNMDGIILPELPNFSSSLSLGGSSDNKSLLAEMNNALGAATTTQFVFQQAPNGILDVNSDSGDMGPALATFISDTSNTVQAPDGFTPGLEQDQRGAYVLITNDGYQIPLLPSPKDPDGIVTAIPGSQVQIGSRGETTISQADGDGSNPIVGIFDPLTASTTQPPELDRSGSGVTEEAFMVYPDGTSQRLMRMIRSPDEFISAAGSFEGVNGIEFNIDGTIDLQYEGSGLILRPGFDITPGNGSGSVTLNVVIENGRYFFINTKGDRQELFLVI